MIDDGAAGDAAVGDAAVSGDGGAGGGLAAAVPARPSRRLVLLRHAKSARPHGVPDHDRPLAGRGRRDARAAARWFAQEGPRPDLVLVSGAVRARQTWQLAGALVRATVHTEEALYGADVKELVALVRSVADDVTTLVVVGHEPTMSGAAIALAGPGSDVLARRTLAVKYPTTGIAVLRLDAPWHELGGTPAVLESFTVPRG